MTPYLEASAALLISAGIDETTLPLPADLTARTQERWRVGLERDLNRREGTGLRWDVRLTEAALLCRRDRYVSTLQELARHSLVRLGDRLGPMRLDQAIAMPIQLHATVRLSNSMSRRGHGFWWLAIEPAVDAVADQVRRAGLTRLCRPCIPAGAFEVAVVTDSARGLSIRLLCNYQIPTDDYILQIDDYILQIDVAGAV